MVTNPSDASQFLIGTDIGLIVNVSRISTSVNYAGPRIYKTDDGIFLQFLTNNFPDILSMGDNKIK